MGERQISIEAGLEIADPVYLQVGLKGVATTGGGDSAKGGIWLMALFYALGAPEKISQLIQGESLLRITADRSAGLYGRAHLHRRH